MAETQEQHSAGSKFSSRPVGRRDLLKIGATTAVVPAVLGPASLTEKRKTAKSVNERELATGPISIGFWSGDTDTAMVNARSLASGDHRFQQFGARVTMIGSSAGIDDRGNVRLQSLAVDISADPVAYRAWRFASSPVLNVSSPASFHVPVDDKRGLRFTVESLARGLSGTPKAGGFRLSLGKEASTAKLNAGYYVIAVGERGRSLKVNWAGYELVGDSTGQTITLQRNGNPAEDFAYVLFAVSPDNRNGGGYI